MSSHSTIARRNRLSQNQDKQLLRKLYSQYNLTQHQLAKGSASVDHKDNIIKDATFVSSNNENYTKDQISRAYKFLCNSSEEGVIDVKSLIGFLEEQGESFYTGVEMVGLLDKQKKGYVNMEEFFGFFQKGTCGSDPDIPQDMKKDQALVKTIDKHYDGLLKNFEDPDFCQYAAKQIKRFKYSQQL